MTNITKKFPGKVTQIVCTIGPKSWDESVALRMVENGMNIARVNGAFADTTEMLKVEKLYKGIDQGVGLMIDIKGPEVRLNKFPEPIEITAGRELTFSQKTTTGIAIYPANYPETYKKLTVGQEIAVGDGDVRLEVSEIIEEGFKARVKMGSILKPGKAINFPGLTLQESPLTDYDLILLNYAIERNWEYVSASFIRNKEDALEVKSALKNSPIKLIAKIEDETGIANIKEITEVVDGLMVARGGLAVDMGYAAIPVAQRKIMAAGRNAGKPVIVATEMMQSMVHKPYPTRAEANDVGTAILDGAFGVMLSEETTMGDYPAEVVEFMSKIEQDCRQYLAR